MQKDKPTISQNNNLIEINHGKRFPFGKSYPLYIFLFLVMIASFFSPLLSLAIAFFFVSVLLVLFLYTANTGIVIRDRKENKFYMRALGFEIGTWEKFRNFSCLVLKTTSKKRENTLVNQYGHAAQVIERYKTTEVYMMDSSHRKKIFCGSFDSYEEAKELAKKLNLILGYPIEKFSPQRIQRRR